MRSATGDALDRYAAGEYETAMSTLALLGGFNAQQADSWIRAAGSQAMPRRRLVAATLALDYTASRPGLSPSLIDWARDTVRASRSLAWEALWLRASVALAEGAQAWTFLTPVPSGYLSEARARFPDDPYFKLAEAVGVEVLASEAPPSPLSRNARGPVALDRLAAVMLDPVAGQTSSDRAARVERIERAALAFEALLREEPVRAEAHLRLGFSQLRLGRRDLARQHFRDAATATSDRFVTYLAPLFTGWALARDGRADAAAAAYRSALEVIPRARSATTLLTALLFMNNRLTDAETVATEFLSAPAAMDDPWRDYPLGDYRSYPALIAQLREAMR